MHRWLEDGDEGQDFEFPDSLEAGELGGYIPESPEVILQRIKDLCKYLRDGLPEVYGLNRSKVVEIKQEKVDIILFELNEEFTSSIQHKWQMVVWLTSVVRDIVEDKALEDIVEFLDKHDNVSDLDEDSMTADVLWGELIPEFKDNGLETASALAKAHVVGMLNYSPYDETWNKMDMTFGAHLSTLLPNYWGFVGMYLIGAYLQVAIDKKVPTIKVSDSE